MTISKRLKKHWSITEFMNDLSGVAWQEFEQGIVRIIFIMPTTVYLFTVHRLFPYAVNDQFVLPLMSYILFIILVPLSFLVFREPSLLRRGIGMISDNAIVFYGLSTLCEYSAPHGVEALLAMDQEGGGGPVC